MDMRVADSPTRTHPFPPWPPAPTPEQEQALLTVLRSGQWGANQGSVGRTFAASFAARHGAKHGICVANGTVALTICLKALGVVPGDEVIMPAYTFVATATAALLIGAVPVFADVDPATMSIDAASVEARISDRTKVIVPVHIAGCPADMDSILNVARARGLFVLEDAAQAHGAEWRGRPVGAIGDLGSFSFQASKNMTAGEGGAIVTNSDELHEQVWSLHNVGRTPNGDWYQHDRVGWNFRLSEFQAAVLDGQLDSLDRLTKMRANSAHYLLGRIAEEVNGVEGLAVPEGVTRHAWHLVLLRFDPARFGGMTKEQLVDALVREGIPTSAGYPALNAHPAIRRETHALTGIDPTIMDCPHAEAAELNTFWLPQNVLLGDHDDLDDVVLALQRIQRRSLG